ncbi:MAG: outer membrane beta-barrel protein [Geobacteraceae bacterium]|nr:outer membrane beta-barrel protein [Geobacteraceae bacterium]
MMRVVWLAVAFLLSASPVCAELSTGTFSATVGGVGYLSDGQQHQKFGPGISAKLGYDFTKHFGLEGSFDYVLSKSSLHESYWTSRYAFRLDAVYNILPDSRFVPYVSGGAGFVYIDDMPSIKDNFRTDLLLSVGGGARFFLTDSFALRADLRPVITFGEGTFVNAEAMLGVTYYFGATKQKAAPVAVTEPRVITQEEEAVAVAVPVPVPLPAPVEEGATSWEGTVDRVPAGKTMITGMKIEGDALVIKTAGRTVNYRPFSLSQPSRLVLDMANTINGMGTNKILVYKLGIATVRFGGHQDSLRVVLDAEQSELFPYRIEEIENGLKIIVTAPL